MLIGQSPSQPIIIARPTETGLHHTFPPSSLYSRMFYQQKSRHGRNFQHQWHQSRRRGSVQSLPGMAVGLAGEIWSFHGSAMSTTDNRSGFERSNVIKLNRIVTDAFPPAAHSMEKSRPRVVPQLATDSSSPVQTLRREVLQSYHRDRWRARRDTQSVFQHCHLCTIQYLHGQALPPL